MEQVNNRISNRPQRVGGGGRRRLEDQSIYERNNDKLMILSWFMLVVVQWNCLGETLDIIDIQEQNPNRFIFGVIAELIINLVFCFDFFYFKKENYQNLDEYSNIYLGIDFLSGPVALIGDIISLIFQNQLNIYSTVFRCSKALSSIYARRVFSKVGQIIPKVKDMFLCLFCVFYLFTYIATYLYGDLFQSKYYFNSIGFSFFTMLQIMTLDGWGEIGRDILRRQNMLSASFLIVFVFIMAYFFWNILIGFILEILRQYEKTDQDQKMNLIQMKNITTDSSVKELDQSESQVSRDGFVNHHKSIKNITAIEDKQTQSSKDFSMTSNNKVELLQIKPKKSYEQNPTTITIKDNQNNQDNSNNNQDDTSNQDDFIHQDDSDQEKMDRINSSDSDNFFENFCFGTLYKKVAISLYFLIILNSLFNPDLTSIDGTISEILHVTTSFIYTIHTLFIYTQNTPRFIIERKHTWMMFFHIISGPTALFFDIATLSTEGTIGLGGIFKLFKAFTVTRETIMGAIMIFPILLPAFLGIISIIFLLAMWSLSYLKTVENFWVDFNTSVYTFVQILTLDDWAAKIIKDLLKQDRYLTPFVFVGFIFVANYFFLNMMVAFSCETFKKVSNEDYVYRNERKQTDFYEQDDNTKNNKNGAYNSLSELQQDLALIKDSHLNRFSYALIQDIGPQKQLTQQEQKLYQILLKAKNYQLNLSSPITFTLNGKTISLRQKDLAHLKFNLCNANVEDGSIQTVEQV